MLDLEATEEAFASAAAAVRGRCDVVEVDGPDAGEYLHGQLSQDVLGLAVGESAPSLLLQPQGKVDAWFRITRMGDDRYWLDLAPGFGAPTMDRLERFKLRMAAELRLLELDLVAVRGPVTDRDRLGFATPDGGAIVDAHWPGTGGFDVLGAAVELPQGMPEGRPEALEALRIRLGIPAMGAELTASTIPNAAGIVDRSVDFTKGCYVGQELVARIDSRGNNTPTSLRGFRFGSGAPLAPGADVLQDGKSVGSLTSVAVHSSIGGVGLGYVKRAVEVPATAQVALPGGGQVEVEIVEL